jgi:DNA modification methylase
LVSYVSQDNKGLLLIRDSRALPMIPARSVAVIVTAPPYWSHGRGRASAIRYVRQLATEFAREWRRVLSSRGDLWIVIGDRHDGKEWIGIDGLVTDWFRRTGWSLQAKGLWAEHPSNSPWDERVNYILRFKKAGARSLPPKETLCWRLPLPTVPARSMWNGIPTAVTRELLRQSPLGTVLDPFFGTGTVGAVAAQAGRSWIGVERDKSEARFAVRRLHLKRQARLSAKLLPRIIARQRNAAPQFA